MVREDKVEHRFEWRLAFGFRQLRNRFARELLQFRVENLGDHHSWRSATIVVQVFPLGLVDPHLLLDALSNGRIAQPFEQLIRAPVRHPGRQAGGQRRCACQIGVHVRGNVQAGIARRLNFGHHFAHRSPTRLAAYLEMKNLHRQSCFTADAESFLQRRGFRASFAAHVRGVEAAILGRHAGQCDKLARLGVMAGRVDQSRR